MTDFNAQLGIYPPPKLSIAERGLIGFFMPWNYKYEMVIKGNFSDGLAIL